MPDITDNACKGVDILKTIILMNEDLNRPKGMLVNITNLYQSLIFDRWLANVRPAHRGIIVCF